MAPRRRAVRVGDEILKETAQLLLEKVKDPRTRGATLTGIRLTDDLKSARIFYSVLSGKDVGESEVEQTQAGLDSARSFIKRELGIRMALRYVPEIVFVYDPTLATGSRLEKIFEEMDKV